MSKQIIKNYTFDATNKVITLTDFTTLSLERLALITDTTSNTLLYNFADPTLSKANIISNSIVLSTIPNSVLSTDKLRIDYDSATGDPTYDSTNATSAGQTVANSSLALIATNTGQSAGTTPQNAFRDPMTSMNATNWDFTTTKAASDIVYQGGNAAAAAWVGIVKSAIVADTYTEFVSKKSWPLSMVAAAGVTLSNRVQGQEFAFDVVGVDTNGAVVSTTPITDTALGVSAVATGSIITYTTIAAHSFVPGDVIAIYGSADPRLNFGPITIQAIPTSTSFTIASNYTATTYSTGSSAFARFAPPDLYAQTVATTRFWGASSTNADAVSKNGGRMPETINWNPATSLTDPVIPSENGLNYASVSYAYPQRARFEFNVRLHSKYAKYFIRSVDSTGVPSATIQRTNNIPDASRTYKLRFRAANLPNALIPAGYITAASKSASTTATFTIPSHGLTTSDWVYIYGIRDQTNFANNAASTQVVSVVNSNQVTISFGASATATSYGGFVMRAHGNAAVPAITSSAIQTYAKTTDGLRLSVVYLATPGTTIVPGEIWTLYGLVDSSNTAQTGLYGRYRVELVNVTTFVVELTPVDGQSLSGVSTSSANAGGTLIRNSELRVHFVRVESEQNQVVEVIGAEGDSSSATALTVNTNGNNVNALLAGTTAAINTTQGSRGALGVTGAAVIAVTDRASAALTASANSGTIANDYGNALSALVSVSAVSGTTPRMDVALQESFDNGTTYQDIFHVPRFTATGFAITPYQLIGGRRRWNYLVNGTTPSFTFSITANAGALAPSGILRNFFDYTSNANGTINVNTAASTTPSWYVEGCKEYSLSISMGAVTTTAPVFQLQTSPDNVTWFNVGATITGTASTNVLQSYSNTPARYMRIMIATAGSGATCNFVNISGR